MKIKTSELKSFKQNASFVKTKGVLPILGYLKVDNGTITKTGLECFIVQDIECKGSVLIDENILFNFLGQTNEPTIEVTIKDKRVTISDGNIKVSFPEEDINNFPAIPESESERTDINNDVFCAIRFAANFVDHMDIPDARAHVFLGNNIVFGGNGLICYMEKFKEKIPQAVLMKDFALVIGKFNTATFSESEKYMFFETDNCRYGFIKSMYPFTDMSKVIKYTKDDLAFNLDKSDLLTFSDLCISSTKAALKVATLSVSNNKLNMEMVDPDFEVNVNKSVPIGDGSMENQFTFNPVQMSTMLKNIPDEELTLYRTNGSLIMTGETGFTSIIQQLQK